MSQNKTQPTDQSVAAYVATLEPMRRRAEAETLTALFQRVSGYRPVVWGDSIIGFGQYHYRYNSGREGHFLATGFAPRKARHSIYIMPGYQDYGAILSRLGKHKTGRACLYVNKLADIDLSVLEELIERGLSDLNKIWEVTPR